MIGPVVEGLCSSLFYPIFAVPSTLATPACARHCQGQALFINETLWNGGNAVGVAVAIVKLQVKLGVSDTVITTTIIRINVNREIIKFTSIFT